MINNVVNSVLDVILKIEDSNPIQTKILYLCMQMAKIRDIDLNAITVRILYLL